MKNKKLLKTVLCITSGIGFATSIPFLTTSCGSSSTKTNILPYEVYDIDQAGVLNGFKSGINLDEYNDGICDTMQIPASVTSVANDAFYDGKIPSFIHSLTFENGSNCSSIGVYTFTGSTGLTSVDLSRCIKLSLISLGAFSRCNSLTSINLSKCVNLLQISSDSFTNCTSLYSIDLSNCINVSLIGQHAFNRCFNLSSITLPSSLTKIDYGAFYGCINLNYIAWNLPNEYENSINIGNNVFYGIAPRGIVRSLNPSITSNNFLTWIKTKGDFPSTDWISY